MFSIILLVILLIGIILDFKIEKERADLINTLLDSYEDLMIEHIRLKAKIAVLRYILDNSEKTVENTSVTLKRIKVLFSDDQSDK